MAQPPHIILLLGNPGDEYAETRHNLGWWVGDRLAERSRSRFKADRGEFRSAAGRLAGKPVILVKPTTYMNLSGRAIVDLGRTVDVEPERLIVVADDFALPLGRLRIRRDGSAGGHNGLASVIEHIGTDRFTRVRLGVGPVPDRLDPAEFVLDPFAADQLIAAQELAVRASEAIVMMLARGVGAAANVFNRKPPAPDDPPAGSSDANDRGRAL
jgi:PTH1 family peptidyl-tRNA hydrolase